MSRIFMWLEEIILLEVLSNLPSMSFQNLKMIGSFDCFIIQVVGTYHTIG